MKRLLSALLLFCFATVVATAANTGTFWVKEDGLKVSFHVVSPLSDQDPEYPLWVLSMVLVVKDINEIQAEGKVRDPVVTSDPSNRKIILAFERIGSKITKKELVEIFTVRLNKWPVRYKETSPPKRK